ncbi:aldose 1-epimerase family protein [Stieleria sp. TO1_6]|uniref:aldose 1-epimerase family protein n=1 Tax=Stieleria tagensis TaxID=2956795 RepID=UPI00209AD804|nr:aldose 1-epimerase family protein [Stieleria tagensis]MCO8120785.1 aldose 1-epimerase family protein [Stieleria tagensis]
MARTTIARSLADSLQNVAWDESSPLTVSLESARGEIQTRHGRFVGGRADGVEIVRIDTGAVVVHVLPTRGMAIWKIEHGPVRFGWDSPVDGPVHPSLVPIHDPSGLGWLEGFDELLVRCGLESNGAPEHDDHGRLAYPLHGRIGNMPADGLEIEYDEVTGRLELIGYFRESRLFFSNFRLRSRVRVHAGSPVVDVLDDVTNDGSQPATMQLLYHINVGAPVLENGSSLVMPIDELAPKDKLSAEEIDAWNEYSDPQSGYAERVYFAKLLADEANLTTAMLQNADASKALAVTYSVKSLPRFVVWKNTADRADGYVTGLEPATNYPNQRSFEASQQRVVQLQPEQTASFRITLNPMTDAESVATVQEKIDKLTADHSPNIHRVPRPGWTPGA